MKTLLTRAGALALIMATMIATPAVLASTASAATSRVKVVGWVACDSGGGLVLTYKPRTHLLSCADANSGLRKLSWSAWSQQSATGAGVYYWNDCTPSCSAGKMLTSKATVELRRPRVQHGDTVFTRVVIRYTDASGQSQVDRSTNIPWTG